METGQVQVPEAPSPKSDWAAAGIPTPSLRRRNLKDRLARYVVCAGGFAIVAGVLGILIFIGLEVMPLLRGASAASLPPLTLTAGSRVITGGVNEHETLGYVISATGRLEYFKLGEDPVPPAVTLAGASGRSLTCAFTEMGEGQ